MICHHHHPHLGQDKFPSTSLALSTLLPHYLGRPYNEFGPPPPWALATWFTFVYQLTVLW